MFATSVSGIWSTLKILYPDQLNHMFLNHRRLFLFAFVLHKRAICVPVIHFVTYVVAIYSMLLHITMY